MTIQVGHSFLFDATLFLCYKLFCFLLQTFLAFSQQPAGTRKLIFRLGLCFVSWDRRLFAEGYAQSTTVVSM